MFGNFLAKMECKNIILIFKYFLGDKNCTRQMGK